MDKNVRLLIPARRNKISLANRREAGVPCGSIRNHGSQSAPRPTISVPDLAGWCWQASIAFSFSQTDLQVFDQIEKLKQDLTDRYVVVDASVPELMRFEGHVGQVKTVNMSGRALVQFDAWNNIGWYDIDVGFLKVVPKPEASAEATKHEAPREAAPKPAPAKPAGIAGEKKLSPLEMARMQGAAKPAGEKAPAAAQPAPVAVAKKSTAEILAAARAKKTAETAAAAPVAEWVEPKGSAIAASAAAKPAAVAAPKPAPSQPASIPGQRPTVSEILAWCRAHDAK
jgi:hypothetical protein